jgi:hypothetical protein
MSGHCRHLGSSPAPGRAVWRAIALAAACGVVWPASAPAQPPMRSEELLRQWDLNRDGKVDEAEAEIARSKMRRARNEAMQKNDTDPITGRPRSEAAAAAGRGGDAAVPRSGGAGALAEDDGGLILVPGNGEQSPFAGPDPAAPVMPRRRDRDPLPGTSVPATTSTIPSVSPPSAAPGGSGRAGVPPTAAGGRGNPGGELSSRARILPDGSPAPQPSTAVGRQSSVMGQPPRPGVIAGGARPTIPGGRSAAAVPSPNLNAGRPPAGGMPRAPTQPFGGTASGGPRGGQIRGGSQPTIPQAGVLPPGASASMRGPLPPQPPATGSSPYRSGMRSPTAPQSGRMPQAAPAAVPRPPRMGPEDFYGR